MAFAVIASVLIQHICRNMLALVWRTLQVRHTPLKPICAERKCKKVIANCLLVTVLVGAFTWSACFAADYSLPYRNSCEFHM